MIGTTDLKENMEKPKNIKCTLSYDEDVDILYVSFGEPKAAISVEVNDGELIRSDPYTDDIVGFTIIDFKQRLMEQQRDFDPRISKLIDEHFWELG